MLKFDRIDSVSKTEPVRANTANDAGQGADPLSGGAPMLFITPDEDLVRKGSDTATGGNLRSGDVAIRRPFALRYRPKVASRSRWILASVGSAG